MQLMLGCKPSNVVLNAWVKSPANERSSYFGVLGTHRHGLSNLKKSENFEYRGNGNLLTYLLVNNYMNLDTFFGLALQDPIKPVFRIFCWRATEIQLGSEPPTLQEYGQQAHSDR